MSEPQPQLEILPGPDGQWRPCPVLLTEQEAIQYLRLDTVGIADPGIPYADTATRAY